MDVIETFRMKCLFLRGFSNLFMFLINRSDTN